MQTDQPISPERPRIKTTVPDHPADRQNTAGQIRQICFGEKGQAGFTLLEFIMVLVLAGMLAALANLGLLQVSEGYLTVRDHQEMTQKAELAMARLVKEFAVINQITSSSATSITYSNYRPGSITAQSHTLAFAGNTLYWDANPLLGGVGDPIQLISFSLTYTSLTTPSPVIVISFSLQGPQGGQATFTNRATPRNCLKNGCAP